MAVAPGVAVTVFSGLQSLSFYVFIAWLPSVLRDHGTDESRRAGYFLSFK